MTAHQIHELAIALQQGSVEPVAAGRQLEAYAEAMETKLRRYDALLKAAQRYCAAVREQGMVSALEALANEADVRPVVPVDGGGHE